MAYYLVTADPKRELLPELKKLLYEKSFSKFKPFGNTLTCSLSNAKIMKNGKAVWEEEDYCTPTLKEEREYVLDKYFDNINVQKVSKGEGWQKINSLRGLFEEIT